MTTDPVKPVTDEKPAYVAVADPNGAPIIYFDGVTNFGTNTDIMQLTLAASRYLSSGEGVTHDVIAVGFLRCHINAAIDLKNAIENALLLRATASETKAN